MSCLLIGTVTDLALVMEEHRAAHRIAGLALVQPGMAMLAQVGVRQPIGSWLILCARAERTGSDKQAADTGHSPGPDGWARDRRPRRLLIVDRVGRVELVVGLRSHTGEGLSVYLTDVDVEKLSEGTA